MASSSDSISIIDPPIFRTETSVTLSQENQNLKIAADVEGRPRKNLVTRPVGHAVNANKISKVHKPDLTHCVLSEQPRRSSTKEIDKAMCALNDGKFLNLEKCDDTVDCESEAIRRRSTSMLEESMSHVNTRLAFELEKAKQELELKDEQCKKLTALQEKMNQELVELSAQLFEEANKMVQEAHERRFKAEKLLQEANSHIEVLDAEVKALKALMLTSTPSQPNAHLHPQLKSNGTNNNNKKGHRRAFSIHDFPFTEPKSDKHKNKATVAKVIKTPPLAPIEPAMYNIFMLWHVKPSLDCPFMQCIMNEEVRPCLNFVNNQMSETVFQGIKNNTVAIEPASEKDRTVRVCTLTELEVLCPHRIKIGDEGKWNFISQVARNKVAVVCDFFTYIRYLELGLVKSTAEEVYWEIARLRREVCIAKLGYV